MWIRKPALRNVPVARFNRRGFRRNGSESTTGWGGRRAAETPWAAPERNGGHTFYSEGRLLETAQWAVSTGVACP